MSTVNILHLSDLHFGILPEKGIRQTAIQRREYILDKLIVLLKKMKEDASLWTPDVIAVSGDLGWKGAAADYQQTGDWLGRLLAALDLPAEAIFPCPGNHDINRVEGAFLPEIQDSDQAAYFLSVEHVNRRLPCFRDYTGFLENMGIPPYINGAEDPEGKNGPGYLYGYRRYGGLCFVSLNSAWNCRGDKDQGNLWLGEPLVFDMKKDLEEEKEPVLCLFHHPFDWLADSEKRVYGEEPAARDEILSFSDILLNGHVHGEIRKPDYLENKTYAFTGGALYQKDTYKLSAQIVRIDTDKRQYSTRLLSYGGTRLEWETRVMEEDIPFGAPPSAGPNQQTAEKLRESLKDRRERVLREQYFYPGDQISSTILPDIRASLAAEDGETVCVGNFLEWMDRQKLRHVQLIGEGGMGKTSFLLELCGRLNQEGGSPGLVVSLNEVNDRTLEEAKHFLDNRLELCGLDREAVKNSDEGRQIYLLLDGFNEVKSSYQRLIAGQIEELMTFQAIRMIVTSRQRLDGSFGLYHLSTVRLKELTDEQIRAYLTECGMEEEAAVPFWELLRTPMLLTIYCQTSREYSDNMEADYFRFNRTVRRKGELICNYLEGLVSKRFMQSTGVEEKLSQLVLDLFVMYFILPGIGWHMVQNQLFTIGQEELFGLLEKLSAEAGKGDFLERWMGKRGLERPDFMDDHKVVSLLQYLKAFPSIFYWNGEWMFKHQDYRDVAAALFVVSDCEKAVAENRIPGTLKEIIPVEIMHLAGELLKDYEFVPGRPMGDPLHGVVDLLRGRNGDEVKIPLFNILQIWRYSRGTLSGEDFHELDLKGQILYPYMDGKQGSIVTDFRGASIYLENFLPPGHKGHISCMCYFPDGRMIVTAADDYTVGLWDSVTGELCQFLEAESWMTDVAVSPDGKVIAACGFDRNLWLWSADTGALLHKIDQFGAGMSDSLSFHPSGKQILVGTRNGAAYLWDVKSGRHLMTFPHHEGWEEEEYISETLLAYFSPDGSRIVTASDVGTVKMWNVENGALLYQLNIHTDDIRSVNFSRDGALFVTAGNDRTACVVDSLSGSILHRLKGHTGWIFEAVFSPSGRYVATASQDETARIWETDTGTVKHILSGHTEFVRQVRFSHDERRLATSSCDETARIWDVSTGEILHVLRGHQDIVGLLRYSPDGRFLATGSVDGTSMIWNAKTGEMVQRLGGDANEIWEAFYNKDGSRIVTIDKFHGVIKSWDSLSGGLLMVSKNVPWPVCTRPDGERVLSESPGGLIQEWDIGRNCMTKEYRWKEDVRRLVYSPDGGTITAVTKSGKVVLWDAESGRRKGVLDEPVQQICYSPDGKYLLGTGEETWLIWDTSDYMIVTGCLTGEPRPPLLEFTADSRHVILKAWKDKDYILDFLNERHCEIEKGDEKGWIDSGNCFVGTAASDHSVTIWNLETGTVKYKWEVHKARVNNIIYHNKTSRAATASEDGIICLWDMNTGKQLCTLRTPGYAVYNLKFSDDGTRLLGFTQNLVCSWNLDQERLETIVDHRFDERLAGCRLDGAKYAASILPEDIELLKRYAV